MIVVQVMAIYVMVVVVVVMVVAVVVVVVGAELPQVPFVALPKTWLYV